MPRMLMVFHLWESEWEGQSHQLNKWSLTALCWGLPSPPNWTSCRTALPAVGIQPGVVGRKEGNQHPHSHPEQGLHLQPPEGAVSTLLSALGPTATMAHDSHGLCTISLLSSTKWVQLYPERCYEAWWAVALHKAFHLVQVASQSLLSYFWKNFHLSPPNFFFNKSFVTIQPHSEAVFIVPQLEEASWHM